MSTNTATAQQVRDSPYHLSVTATGLLQIVILNIDYIDLVTVGYTSLHDKTKPARINQSQTI